MYRESEGLDEIKRVINFPKLEMPPADFLQNMEDYAKQAPRQFDDSGPKKVSAPCCCLPASPTAVALDSSRKPLQKPRCLTRNDVAVQKSPPLRKGKYANPRGKGEAPGDAAPPRSSDPGMVTAFDNKVCQSATIR